MLFSLELAIAASVCFAECKLFLREMTHNIVSYRILQLRYILFLCRQCRHTRKHTIVATHLFDEEGCLLSISNCKSCKEK